MIVLGIETSGYSGGVALIEEDNVLGDLFLNLGPRHSEKLLPMIDWLLEQSHREIDEIDGIAVSSGPGSFTALRIGISTAKGIAFSLGIPVVSVSSLDVIAASLTYAPHMVCSLIDAKKSEVFAAFYESCDGCLNRVSDEMLVSPQAICDMIDKKTIFIGNGVSVYRQLLQESVGDLANFCSSNLNFPRASNCAMIGNKMLREGIREELSSLVPRYLRKSDAEIHKQEANQ